MGIVVIVRSIAMNINRDRVEIYIYISIWSQLISYTYLSLTCDGLFLFLLSAYLSYSNLLIVYVSSTYLFFPLSR